MENQAEKEIKRCQKFLERNDISPRDREAAERGLIDWFTESIWDDLHFPLDKAK